MINITTLFDDFNLLPHGVRIAIIQELAMIEFPDGVDIRRDHQAKRIFATRPKNTGPSDSGDFTGSVFGDQ